MRNRDEYLTDKERDILAKHATALLNDANFKRVAESDRISISTDDYIALITMSLKYKNREFDQRDNCELSCSLPFLELMTDMLEDMERMEEVLLPIVEKVQFFDNKRTVVTFVDGSITESICDDEDTFSKLTGFLVCIAKRVMGNQTFFDECRKHVYSRKEKKVKNKRKE